MVVVHSLHPTKWSVHKPWLYKMVVPVTCFDPQIFWQFCQKMIKPVHSWSYLKKSIFPEPFCRASILARTSVSEPTIANANVHLQNGTCIETMGSLQNGWLIFLCQWLIQISLSHQIIPLKTSTKWLLVCYKMVCLRAHKWSCLQNKDDKTS